MTFLQTGIRLSELANLRVEDVDFDHKVLTVSPTLTPPGTFCQMDGEVDS
jgi:integrase